jgi:hypothetical protein
VSGEFEMSEEKIASVPYYLHEAVCERMERTTSLALDANNNALETNKNAMEKLNISNRRLLIALVTVCVTLVITVCCFLSAYKDMNKNWMDFFENHITEEVTDGSLLDERDPGANSGASEG